MWALAGFIAQEIGQGRGTPIPGRCVWQSDRDLQFAEHVQLGVYGHADKLVVLAHRTAALLREHRHELVRDSGMLHATTRYR